MTARVEVNLRVEIESGTAEKNEDTVDQTQQHKEDTMRARPKMSVALYHVVERLTMIKTGEVALDSALMIEIDQEKVAREIEGVEMALLAQKTQLY